MHEPVQNIGPSHPEIVPNAVAAFDIWSSDSEMSDDEDEAGSSMRPKKTADEEMGAKEASRS